MIKKLHVNRSLAFAALAIFMMMPGKGWGQLYWNTDNASAGWTAANWSTTAVAPFTTAWAINTDAIFTANSTVTFASTSIGNVTVNDGFTVNVTQVGTLSTNNLVRTFTIGTGSILAWPSQDVSNSSSTGFIKNGNGTWNIGANSNSYIGGFTLNSGTVIVTGEKSFGTAALTINGGTLQSSNSSTFEITGLTIGGDFTLAGTGDDIWGAPVALGSSTRTITNTTTSGSRLFSGIISGSTGAGLTFAGNGTAPIQLSGANTYTGLTTVSGGTVQFNRSGGTTIPVTNDVTVTSGTLRISSNQTLNNLTVASGATLTVDAGATLTINGTYNVSSATSGNAGTIIINGTLKINQGGWPGNTGTFSYGGSGTLEFANTTGSYGVGSGDTWWPTTNGPVNITVSGAGGITMNVARIVSGVFQTAAGVTNAYNLTISSTAQINMGGFLTGTPTYSAASILVYNTSSYTTTSNEFPSSGVKNVTITAPSGTNTVTLDGDKTISGTLIVGTHILNGGKSINAATITIGTGSITMGDITTSTALTCSGASVISLTGAWSVTGFTKSTSTVTFTATGNINNATSFYNLTNSDGTRSVTQNIDVENNLIVSGGQVGVTGGAGRSLTMSGANSTININGGAIYGTNAGTGNDLSLIISGNQTTLTGNATASLDDEKKFFNVTVNTGKKLILQRGILCKYGTFTCNGTIQIDANGYIQNDVSYGSNAKAPTYNATSGSLIYNNGGAYTSAAEWPATSSPFNVTLQNAGTNVAISGNRNIEGTLTLTNGLLTTGTNTITIGASGTVSGASASNYIDGKLAQVFASTGSKTFPIGKGGNYRPVNFNYAGGTTPNTITAEQTEGLLPGSAPASATVFASRYWIISESGGASSYFVTLDGTGFLPTYTPVMIKGDGSTNAAYAVTTPNYTNTTGFTLFSNFALGEIANTTTTITPADKTVCYGSTAVELTAVVSPNPAGGTVTFKIGGTSVGSASVDVETGTATLGYNPGLLAIGDHSIHADFSGFGDFIASSSSPDKTLKVNAVPVTPSTAIVDENNFCANATGKINLSVTGGSGTSVGWYTGSCGGTSVGTGNPLEIDKPTNTTTYYARWETSTCGASACADVVVTVTQLPVAAGLISGTTPVTQGASGVAYSVPAITNATSYTWAYSGTNAAIVGSGTSITINFAANATGGDLTVYGVNSCGNGTSATFAIAVNPIPAPTAYAVTGGDSYCEGGAGLPVGIVNSETGVSYELWKNASATGITVSGTTGSSKTFGNQTEGTYTVKGTNGSGTTTMTGSAVITMDLVPEAFAGNTQVCTSGTAFLITDALTANGTRTWSTNSNGSFDDIHLLEPLYTSLASPEIVTVTLTLTVHNTSCPDAVATKILYLTPSTTALTWQGGISESWTDANNWLEVGVPGPGTNVTIPSGKTYYPTLTATANCNNITVKWGASLKDNGYLTLSSGAKIIVEHPAITSGKWHLISSPVANATSGMFLGNYLYNFISSTNNYTPVLSTGLVLTSMKGYALYPKSTDFSVAYVGDLNKASSYSITTTASGGSGLGWNLVGNPYPSAIDWDAASGWVKTGLVSGAIYINNGAVWTSYIYPKGTNGGSKYIAPTQGFFVKGNGGILSMTDEVRVHNTVSFLKSAEDVVPNLVRLQVSGNGYNDEAVVRFFAGATVEMDRDYDAEKLYGDVPAAAQLYTLGSNPLSINTLPSIDNVRVGLKTGIKGSYTIAATELNDLGNATLEDTELGISTDLSAGPYTFDAVAGTFDQRFILHFSMLGLTPTKNVEAAIYSYQRSVHINMKDQVKGDIFIYNISGQQVASKLAAQGMNEIKLTGTGNYIVKVISKNSTIVRKVFILQ